MLEEGKMSGIEYLVIKTQLRWAGHVVRMNENQLLKQVIYSIGTGPQNKGRTKEAIQTPTQAKPEELQYQFERQGNCC